MNHPTAHVNMIEQQIRPWNVLAMQTLDALKQIRRADFVPAEYRHLAFADVRIPLGDGEVMLEPKVSARMVEALQLSATDKVLEVGGGSGYVTALLALLSAHVTSVEINPRLFAQARRNLAAAGANVTIENGDAHAGWGAPGQFDAILLSGSLPHLTDASSWVTALAGGGRLVGIVGHLPIMQVVRLTKTAATATADVVRESLFDTTAPRLRNVEEKIEFQF